LASKVSKEELETIHAEIDDSDFIISDTSLIQSLMERGAMSPQLVASALGAPEEDFAVAQAAHAERLQLISKAQSNESTDANGDNDSKIDEDQSKLEKENKPRRGEE